jgi:hypothetical protein
MKRNSQTWREKERAGARKGVSEKAKRDMVGGKARGEDRA